MKQKFIALVVVFAAVIISSSSMYGQSRSSKNIKFGIIADIHNDIMHDGDVRLEEFFNASEEDNVDFIIQLGDFCQAKESNKNFVKLWNSYKGEKYHVLGNHDMDNCTKDEIMKFIGLSNRYYSFEKGGYKFIILDANNLYSDGKYTHYNKGNYYADAKKRAFIDPEQIEWLKRELASTDKQCFLFSHQSLERVVQNRDTIQSILEKANASSGYQKVVAAFSGHNHTSYKKEINGISYIQINSASNQWVGSKYVCDSRYSAEINKTHTSLKYTTPYENSLYAIVKVNKRKIVIDGIQSKFVSPTPQELNIPKNISGLPLVSEIKDMTILLDKR